MLRFKILIIALCVLQASCTCTPLDTTPNTMASHSANVGKCFEFALTGGTSGSVWGSNIYTADSQLSAAAVHAGIVQDGQVKLVTVRVLPGQSSYQASSRNGIASNGYSSYVLSYEFIGSREPSSKCTPLEETPNTMASHSAHVGRCFEFALTGGTSGSVWGSDIYTGDSQLSAAAVHAGVLKVGEVRLVKVRVLPGQKAYQSATRYDIRSSAYGAYILSYEFMGSSDLPKTCTQLSTTPSGMNGYAAQVGKCLEFALTGQTSGTIWGSDIYTGDSALGRAAVHAGVVQEGQVRLVKVRVLPGQSAYQASTRNGVASNGYGSFGLSYEFIGSSEMPDTCTKVDSAPASLSGYSAQVGRCFEFPITGATGGSVWGSDYYTADSTLGRAAVHAGVVAPGETRPVLVRVLPGRDAYQASESNGVASSSYGRYVLSYEFMERPR